MRSLYVALAAASVAISAAGQAITFSEHIAPILYQNCVSCHRPGQIAPFSLLTYDDAVRHASTMASVTQTRYMPPWKPAAGWQTYRDQRTLTDAQIALIQQWVAQGAPQGDPAKAPAVPTFGTGWQLGTPDLVLTMPKGFNVPASGDDVYRNFVIPSTVLQDKWVTAIEVRSTAPTVLHHILFFTDTTGAARALDGNDGQPGFPGAGTIFTLQASNPSGSLASLVSGGLGAWVPGTTPQYLPTGIATPLPKNADVLLQSHFHPDGLPHTEQTTIGLYFGPQPARTLIQLQAPGFFGIYANIDIPAGVPDYKTRGSFTLPVDVDAVLTQSHMHYLGKEAKLTATLPTGEVKILLWIKNWDFRWQGQYIFQDLVTLPKGTRLDGELVWDNSANNPYNPYAPPQEIKWGEQTTNEMGSMILSVVPHQQSDFNTLQNAVLAYSLTPAPQVGNKPLFVSSGMVDGASTQAGAVTPGKIVVLYGDRIGPTQMAGAQVGPDGKVASVLGGTQVLFDGTPAPLIYATRNQVAAVVPYGVDGKSGTQVQVSNNGQNSDKVALPVTSAGPSIFSSDYTGSGQGAVLNQDGVTVNSSKNPAAKGDIVSIYATGEGQTSPAGVDGKLANSATLPKPVQNVQVTVNGVSVPVLYAGAAPGQVAGLMQVNVQIPANAPSGDVPVQIQVGSAKSQPGITIAVK